MFFKYIQITNTVYIQVYFKWLKVKFIKFTKLISQIMCLYVIERVFFKNLNLKELFHYIK